MTTYDRTVEEFGRNNVSGQLESFKSLKRILESKSARLDYLWSTSSFETLFIELWRIHEKQIIQFCKAHLMKTLRIPSAEVSDFLETGVSLGGWPLFELVFEESWLAASGVNSENYHQWAKVRNQLIHGRGSFSPSQLGNGCEFLSGAILSLRAWGLNGGLRYDGLQTLGNLGLPTKVGADGRFGLVIDESADSSSKPMSRTHKKQWVALRGRIRKADLESE
jgi:hypothetical protein